jgi:hypothetical protein
VIVEFCPLNRGKRIFNNLYAVPIFNCKRKDAWELPSELVLLDHSISAMLCPPPDAFARLQSTLIVRIVPSHHPL